MALADTMSTYTEVPLNDSAVPLPAAYTRHLSYNQHVQGELHDPNVYVPEAKTNKVQITTKANSLKSHDDGDDEERPASHAQKQKSLLIFLISSRVYIRVLAILIMIVSFSLILTAVIMFGKAQNKPGHPLNQIPKPAGITDHPCIVFTGVAAMNFCISLTVLSLSFMSSKFNKTNNAVNAVFAIISAVGFATSMGACFFLNKETTLQNDLWKWSCGNHNNGIVSDVLDFGLVCNVISYGWKFGLVQASLELLTFIVSIISFILIRYALFAKYGRTGKIF